MSATRTVVLLAFVGGCPVSDGHSDSADPAIPTVISQSPAPGATDVATDTTTSATFSVAMDPATLDTTTFVLTADDGGAAVAGSVVYSQDEAVFQPSALLASDGGYTVTVTTGAKSVDGIPLANDYSWSFSTGPSTSAGVPVDLGAAEAFVVLAKSGISTVPSSALTGDIGVSPAAATYLTGFSLTADATNVFSTSTQVTGQVFAADYATPTPANLTAAIGDMELAFADAAGRAPGVTELGAGDIGGLTIAPGVYAWSTGVLVPGDVTLDGNATDVWIFQIAQDLTITAGSHVVLSGGARAENVFWQVAGAVHLGTGAHGEGVVLSQTAVTLGTGASVAGRLLAQTAVALDGNAVVAPTP